MLIFEHTRLWCNDVIVWHSKWELGVTSVYFSQTSVFEYRRLTFYLCGVKANYFSHFSHFSQNDMVLRRNLAGERRGERMGKKLPREVRHYVFVHGLIHNVSTRVLERELRERGYDVSRESIRLIKKYELDTFKKRLFALQELSKEPNVYGEHAKLTIHAIDCTLGEMENDLVEDYYRVSAKILFQCDMPELIYENAKLFEVFDNANCVYLYNKPRDSEQQKEFETKFQIATALRTMEADLQVRTEYIEEFRTLLNKLLSFKQNYRELNFPTVHTFWMLELSEAEGGLFRTTRTE